MNVGIPKLIMQTWKDENVPKKWKSSPISIQRLMPDWEYVLMTDEMNLKFVSLHFLEYFEWFKALKYPIQRADVIRYMWLYKHGGIYIDLDIELVISLDELFTGSMDTWLLKAPRNFAGHYTNFMMASTSNNPFWLDVLKECREPLESWVFLQHHVVSQQTGLAALTRATSKWKFPIALLPQTLLVPCDYCDPTHCQKPFSYTKFLKGQSWNGPDTFLLNLVSCNPEILILLLILVIGLKKIFY